MNNFKKAISVLLVMTILVLANISSLAATNFSDVNSSSWYYTYVNKLIELNITAGVGNNKFAPSASVTRAEFVTFLCKATGLNKEDNGYTYTDTTTHWGKKWISAAVTSNIIDRDTKFNPNTAITRQEAVEMLCRTLSLSEDIAMLTPYSDVAKDAGYSNRAYEEYLMLGSVANDKRYFYPSSEIKRSEVSAVIVNLVDYKANTERYKAVKKAEIAEKEKAETVKQEEAERCAAWKSTLDKGVSVELLKNITGLEGGKTVMECNEYALTDMPNWTAWMEDSNITNVEDFKKEFIRVGKAYMEAYHNRSYLKIDALEKSMNELWAPINVENYLQRNLLSIKNDTVVKEAQFFTGEGLIFISDQRPVLRGTLKYRYLSPTKSNMLNKDFCDETGKSCEINVWYKADIELTFFPEDGLKANREKNVSITRLAR